MGDDKKSNELAESLYQLYTRFGKPDTISLLDGRLSLSWRIAPPSLARYEEISMDAELLHYPSWATWSSSQINVYLYGDELTLKSARSKVRARINDLASTGKGSRGSD